MTATVRYMKINEIKVSNYITKSGLPGTDLVINPYVGCPHACIYCYASFMKKFTGHNEDWGDFTDVKICDSSIKPQDVYGKRVFMSSVTDCYNPLEKKYKITRSILKQLYLTECQLTICTKSDLIIRDLDILRNMKNLTVAFSLNTTDENFRRDCDRASSVEARIRALKVIHDEGIHTVLFMSPIFPGITDVKAIIRRAKNDCNLIWLENLNLRGGYRKTVLDWISDRHPELVPLYEDIYTRGDRRYWEELDADIRAFAEEEGLPYVRNDDSMKRAFSAPPVIVNYFFHEEIIPSARKKRLPSSFS